MEHIAYEKTIKHISKNSGPTVSYSKSMKSDKSSTVDVRIDLELEAMGIGNQVKQELYSVILFLIFISFLTIMWVQKGIELWVNKLN